MADPITPTPERGWFRFSLGHLLVLIAGAAIGFAPLRLWQISHPQPQMQVAIHLQVLDVQRDLLPALGIKTDTIKSGAIPVHQLSGALKTQLVNWKKSGQAKVLAEPTLVTVIGYPASFKMGGEIPVPIQTGNVAIASEYRSFGTQIGKMLHRYLSESIEYVTQLPPPRN